MALDMKRRPVAVRRSTRVVICSAMVLLVLASDFTHRVAFRAPRHYVTSRLQRRSSHGVVARKAGAESSGELYMPNVGPESKDVMKVYKSLISEKDPEVAKRMIEDKLNAEQRVILKKLIEAKGGASAEITTTDPELGDTPARLHKKYQMLTGDKEIIEWRNKLDLEMKQEVQNLIEKEQCALADEEAAQDHQDEEAAKEAYELFKEQFPVPAENQVFFTTPCREVDIKYRFRRLKQNLGIDNEGALQLTEKDSSWMVVDPEYIGRSFRSMVEEIGYEDAMESLVFKNPGSLVADAEKIKTQITQMKMTAAMIDMSSGVGKFFRKAVTDNGRRTPIRASEGGAPFGGGLPAWKRKWEEEERERARKASQMKEKEAA